MKQAVMGTQEEQRKQQNPPVITGTSVPTPPESSRIMGPLQAATDAHGTIYIANSKNMSWLPGFPHGSKERPGTATSL